MKELRVIIAGSRDFDDFPRLMNSSIEILTEISKKRDDLDRIRIISGTARGADKLGEQYAKIAHYELSKFPAAWDGLGKRAGYIRNAEMAKFAVEDSNYGVFLNKNDNGIFIHGTGISWHDSSNNWIKDCMFFNSSGNVTIGSSDLAGTDAKLLVDGNAVIGGAITINKKDTTLSLYSTTEAGIMFTSDGIGGDDAAIYEHKGVGNGLTFGEANRDFIWRTGVDAYKGGGGGTERMRLTNSGNLLIGTTTDNGYKLQVNGSERVYGDLIVDGEVSALVA